MQFFLKKLVENLKVEKPEDWLAEAVAQSLRVADAAEKSEAIKDPWGARLSDLDAEASRKRRGAEELLLAKDAAARGRAGAELSEAMRLYQTLLGQLTTLNDAQKTLNQALVVLPGVTPSLEKSAELEPHWTTAVRTARSLRELLILSAAPGDRDAAMRQMLQG